MKAKAVIRSGSSSGSLPSSGSFLQRQPSVGDRRGSTSGHSRQQSMGERVHLPGAVRAVSDSRVKEWVEGAAAERPEGEHNKE